MAVAIDTAHIAQHYIPRLQSALDRRAGSERRFQVHRVCAYATVVFHDSTFSWGLESKALHGGMLANRDALDWQADPDDDVHELEVLHHLHQQAATSRVFSNQKDHPNDAITLVASAMSPSFSTMTHGRLPSSFHRYSLRFSEGLHPAYFMTQKRYRGRVGVAIMSSPQRALHDSIESACSTERYFPGLQIVWDSCKRGNRYVLWQLQVDVVDLFSQRAHPCSRPGKRRRPTFNPFLQVVVDDTSRGNHLPWTKKFNGIRHRPDRRTWAAEMKPPKHKNKQDFGNFKSEAEAACAVDAAFHHYGKPQLLNFPDSSPNILSSRPPAPADETAKLRFVKQEAKWLATMATNSPLPSACPNSVFLQSPQPSTSCTALPSGGFRSLSEISWPLSCGGPDEADDAVSQPEPWMHFHPFPDIAAVAVQSTKLRQDHRDSAEDCEIPTAQPNIASPRACEMQSLMWLDPLIIRSPPASMYSMVPSPSHCEDDLMHALLEQQRFLG